MQTCVSKERGSVMNEKLDHAVTALATDLDDRMDNIEAIKGKTFAEAVRMSVNMHTIMEIGASDIPVELRRMIVPDMCALHVVHMARALDLNQEQIKEMADMSRGICEQIKSESKRMRPLFDKEFGED
jgi:hypothetical protein